MNIYFDIDGVLKDSACPAADVENLVKYCLTHFPKSTYWLTTHCRGGVNRTKYALNGVLPQNMLSMMADFFLPTDWDVLKTDAIDFDKPFVWFDDTILQAELDVLDRMIPPDESYGLFLFEKDDPNSARDALEYLKTLELQYN